MLVVFIFVATLLLACANAHAQKRDSWGGALSLGPSESTIISAVTTLTPGTAPTTQNGELFLWPGMSNGTGDLIQTTMESWPDNSWCGATTGQWQVLALRFYTYLLIYHHYQVRSCLGIWVFRTVGRNGQSCFRQRAGIDQLYASIKPKHLGSVRTSIAHSERYLISIEL